MFFEFDGVFVLNNVGWFGMCFYNEFGDDFEFRCRVFEGLEKIFVLCGVCFLDFVVGGDDFNFDNMI